MSQCSLVGRYELVSETAIFIYETKLRYLSGELIILFETPDSQNGNIAACDQRKLTPALKTTADLFIGPVKIMNGKARNNIS
jgi:hypothetical protein